MGYVVTVVLRSSTNGICCCSCSKELNQWDMLLQLFEGAQPMGYVVTVVRRSSTNEICCFSCSKELNQWDLLLEYASVKGNANPHLVLESAWRVPNWTLMKDALAQVRYTPVNPHGQYNTVHVIPCPPTAHTHCTSY